MSRTLLRLPAMLFCIPFVYVTLFIDVYFQSVAGFFLTLILALVIGIYFKATDQLKLWFVGNLVSTVLSILLQYNHPEWGYVYQPYNPVYLVLGLSFLYLIPQIIGIVWATFLHIKLIHH